MTLPATSTVIQCPALFVAAPASNQGKTTVTAALARFHTARGRRVRIFKTGPDFLDPMILERASGNPVYQLDLWMSDEQHCRELLYAAAADADLILIEGVMGLFDGDRSSADLATLFGIPVLAVIDGSGMAQTFGAVAYGLANYQPGLPFAGVFANRVGSERHYEMLVESLPEGQTAFGWLKRNEDIVLPNRHLGLVQADEIADLEARIQRASQALLGIPDELPPAIAFSREGSESSSTESGVTGVTGVKSTEENNVKKSIEKSIRKSETKTSLTGVRVAIARDTAFAFLYPANLDFLRSQGAELSFFSPLTDDSLPEADALYLPGGYPELHLEQLAANLLMKAAIRVHHDQGKAIYAECGGMLYLVESLTNVKGKTAEMTGLLPGRASMQSRLSNLGLHGIELPEGNMRGHTYHYSTLECPLAPIAVSEGARKGRRGEPVYRQGQLNASYLHLYFPSNPIAAAKLFSSSEVG